jgi:hypothetical protein
MPIPGQYAVCLLLLTLAALGVDRPAPAAEKDPAPIVRLAAGGRSLLPVVAPAKSSERVRRAAGTLADYLGRISGVTFAVEAGDGRAGIAVGRAGDFPALDLRPPWDAPDPARREDYLLRSHGRGLHLIGATDLAVEHAVWDLLYRLGHRQFFPGPTWEVVPRTADLAIDVDAHEHPAFLSRDIGYGFGPWDGRGQPYVEWCARNRLGIGGPDPPLLESGHAYDRILADCKDEFDKHPEYLALVGGRRRPVPGETKFCIGNPGLRRLVARYAVDHFTRHPEASSISLEPSDGLSWCECEQCRALGSVSDRVVTLVNEAAVTVRARHGRQKWISIYAYAAHAPPPHVQVDAQVVVNVATCMTTGGYTTDELIDGWRKQGAQLGIREYYGVYPWDRDLPGQPRAADLGLLAESTRHFHRQGARFLCAESSDNWGVAGPGYYLLARLLWDLREADRVAALRDDFLDKAFGSARKPMAEFYRHIDAAGHPRLSTDLIGRLYRALDEAWKQAGDPAIAARIGDLVLYVRYVELYYGYAYAEGPERQRGFEALCRYTYRMRRTGMVHSLAVWRGLPYYDRTVHMPAGVGYEVPEGKDPWKDSTPFSRRELQDFVTAGVARHPLIDITPVAYGTELVSAAPLALPAVPAGSAGLYFRGRARFYTWVAAPPAALPLTVKSGVIQDNVGNARLSLHRVGTAEAADRAAVPPDGKEHAVRLRPAASGLHRVELSDGTAGTALSWPAGMPWTVPAGPQEATELYGRWTMYCYVPKGTKEVAGYAEGPGVLLDGSGTKVYTFGGRPDYFRVPVAPGQGGRLWQFAGCLGRRVLLTVPPYLARDGREVLLPAEVVRADRAK